MHKDDEKGPRGDKGTDNIKNRSSVSPAHWQGEPVPHDDKNATPDVGFDQRAPGRGAQYGRAGVYGKRHNKTERRPARGERQPDEAIRGDVWEALVQSGVNVAAVTLSVSDGVVNLSGYVDHADDCHALERIAANRDGVVDIRNSLDTAPASDPASSQDGVD